MVTKAAEPTPDEPLADGEQPERPLAAETVQPRRYGPGDEHAGAIYGVLDPQGRVTLTGQRGSLKPPPGSRGVILHQRGDVLSSENADRLSRA